MAAKLVAEEGLLKGLVLSLEDGDQWIIGRDPDACQLLVEDPSTSRKHLICRTSPEGILVENLSETNPTEVNEEKIKEPRLLRNGDAVKIGDGTFRFYTDDAAQLLEEKIPEEESQEEGFHEEESSEALHITDQEAAPAETAAPIKNTDENAKKNTEQPTEEDKEQPMKAAKTDEAEQPPLDSNLQQGLQQDFPLGDERARQTIIEQEHISEPASDAEQNQRNL